MLIRQERTEDYKTVYALILQAFETAEHRDGNEQDLVAALRGSDAFIPSLSLVAEVDGEIVGHILFTKAWVGTKEVLALAPLSVRPGFQKQGIGTALIHEGHRIAKQLGYPYSLVVGSESYYPRMGYMPAETLGIKTPEGIPPVNFMANKLQRDAEPLYGTVIYAKEFGI